MRSWPGDLFFGSLLIMNIISEGDVCLARKDIGREVSKDCFIWSVCSNIFISECGEKLFARCVAKRLALYNKLSNKFEMSLCTKMLENIKSIISLELYWTNKCKQLYTIFNYNVKIKIK
jgi:hypothetical protein